MRPVLFLSEVCHVVRDLETVSLARSRRRRWAFTTSNAGAAHFEDYCELESLDRIDWEAVQATDWQGERKFWKQAEFLVEGSFPWRLVQRIGVMTPLAKQQVFALVPDASAQPSIEVRPDWYY